MDFFGRQAASRRLSRQLVALFALAVASVAVAVAFVVLAVLALVEPAAGVLAPFNPDWLAARAHVAAGCVLAVVGTIGVASLYKSAQLRQGGRIVAQSVGGELVPADTTDPLRRRLLNVVDEMAIASGVPVPQVFVLEHEPGINAFAAGHTPANAAIAVTRGALVHLERDELQGVIAHEFSHILNGDMRLNIRMMGLLFGLLSIAMIGRLILRHAPRGGGRRGRGAPVIALAALLVMLLGYAGLFFGRLIQAAVSRSRESLADASAVQFTRDREGLRDALVKIGAVGAGSVLQDTDAEAVAHMLFAAGIDRAFATHPPLAARIRAIDPSFDEREFDVVRERLAVVPDARPGAESAPRAGAMGFAPSVRVAPQIVARLVGNPATVHVGIAAALRESLPESIRTASGSPRQAAALLLALAVDPVGPDERGRTDVIEGRLGAAAAAAVRGWLPAVRALQPLQRLPAFLRLFPALQQFSREERQQLTDCLHALLRDGTDMPLPAFILARVAEEHLQEGLVPPGPSGHLTLAAVRAELRTLFGVLALHGHGNRTLARQAYEAGMHHLLPRDRPSFEAPARWQAPLIAALDRLDKLQPAAKEQLVEALVRTIAHDGAMTLAEAELLRMIAATVHCPLPPLADPTD